MRRLSLYPLLAALILEGYACKVSQKVSVPVNETYAANLQAKIKKSKKEITSFYIENYRCTLDVSGSSTGFSGHIKANNPGRCLISVSSMTGIEGLRILLTEDSLKVVNRMEKSFFYLTRKELEKDKSLFINSELLWRLITNQWSDLLLKEKNTVVKRGSNEKEILVEVNNMSNDSSILKDFEVKATLSGVMGRVKTINMTNQKKNFIADLIYKQRKHQDLPKEIFLKIIAGRDSVALKMKILDSDTNGSYSLNFAIPGKYRIIYEPLEYLRKLW
jgi:hypothetical protein